MSHPIRKPVIIGILVLSFLGVSSVSHSLPGEVLAGAAPPGVEQNQEQKQAPSGAGEKGGGPQSTSDAILRKLDDLERRLGQLEKNLSGTGSAPPTARSPTQPPEVLRVPRAGAAVPQKGKGLQPRGQREYAFAIQRHLTSPRYRRTPALLYLGAPPAEFDLRTKLNDKFPGKSLRLWIRDQQTCGCCWDFAAVAAFEANYVFSSGQVAFASEQQILNCCAELGRGNCGGSTIDAGLWFLAQYGTVARPGPDLGHDDYAGVEKPCNHSTTPAYRASNWGHVRLDSPAPPTVEALQQVIMQYGAVVVGFYASDAFVQFGFDHTGEVWDQNEVGDLNHAIAIIGWSTAKGAWLVKNSWGPTWGHAAGFGDEAGYMWVKYGVNGIGSEACWVQAQVPVAPQPQPQPPSPSPQPQPDCRDAQTLIPTYIQEWINKRPDLVPWKKPGPATTDTDLAKLLKGPLAQDAVPGASSQLAELYLHLADIFKRQKNPAVNAILTIRNGLLKLATWSEANKLKETSKAIDGFLTDYLSTNHIDVTANLTKNDAAKVSGAFQTIAETLQGFP